jgi:hypothetical protein
MATDFALDMPHGRLVISPHRALIQHRDRFRGQQML